jgi:hypothetical protein
MANPIETTVASFLETAIGSMLTYVPDDKIESAADAVIDKLQELVDSTGTLIDDAIVEPILAKVRSAFEIAG